MDTTRLINAIEMEEESAFGRLNDELSSDRAEAINAYLGKPYGNEIEGQSQIVSRDTMETVEWIKPSLTRIFCSGDTIVKFEPVGPEDVQMSEQETDYVNHIVQQKNNWFDVFNTWSSDALLTKNAYCLAYWDEKEDTTKERYQGLTDDQMALLAQDEDVEIIGHQAYPAPMPPQMAMMAQAVGQTLPQPMLHDVVLQKKKTYGCVKLEVLPPERCLVARSTHGVSVREADFFEYWEIKSISDLRSMGFKVPDDIADSSDTGGAEFSSEDIARDQYNERLFDDPVSTGSEDPSMRKVKARMVWIKHDYNGDGLAEHVQLCLVGKTILKKEDDEENGIYEVDGVPVACIVPNPLPHRHIGMSVYDMVGDLQFIKSMIKRQVMNNIALANNPRTAISDKVNLDDMLTSRVGGIVRVDGIPSQHMMPVVVPFMGEQALRVLEHIDQEKENRTGTNRYFSGTDQGSLNKTATGIAQLTSSAAQRVEQIGRIFAEGVKDLFQIVHELTLKHARQAEIVRLRNQWVPVDPRQWKKRADLTISVGLGTGNKEVVANNLMNVFKTQMATVPMGIATPQSVRETLLEMTKAYGFPAPEKFWPEVQEKAPPPDPAKLQEAMKQLQQMQQQIQQAGQQVKEQHANLQVEKIGLEADKKMALADITIAQTKLDAKAQVTQHKLDSKAKEINAQTDENGDVVMNDDEDNKQLDALTQAIGQLAQLMEQTIKIVSAPKVLKKLPDGTKAAVPLIGN